MSSWVHGSDGSGFDADHLPYGVFDTGGARTIGVRIGGSVLDTAAVLPGQADVLRRPTLNGFLAGGPALWDSVRARITELLVDPAARARVEPHLVPLASVALHLPIAVGDYVDFYASEHHAATLGRMFRPGSEPLLPNWKHLPVGYHGRSGTVVASGTPIRRPHGQSKAAAAAVPEFGVSSRLDIEAEVGFVVGVGSELGRPIPVSAFADHVFGICLVNDWSARDIQPWEYVPLGPFVAKSFATSISHWITPLAALQEARVAPPQRTAPLLPYLADGQPWGLDLALTVRWNDTEVSRPPFRNMYWTGAQMLAHQTVGGASTRPGDLYASGTVSGPDPGTAGSFIELAENGSAPVTLADGRTRTFLEDGDSVTITATAPTAAGFLELGEVSGTVLPALEG